MSTGMTLDVNFEGLPAQALLKLIEARQKAHRFLAAWQATVNQQPGLFRRLEELGIEPRFNLTDGCIDLSFSGNGELFKQVWHELRCADFKNDGFPRKGETTFATHWRPSAQHGQQAVLWMYFVSSLCKQVQIGTRMVEQPVYEVQCGDPMPSMEEQTPLGELLSAEDQLPRIEEIL